MPSFGRQSRNYSWPPSLHHVSHLPHIANKYNHGLSQRPQPESQQNISPNNMDDDIDNNPFAYFISPMSDDDDPQSVSMSAGITTTESVGSKRDRFVANLARRWARSVSSRHHPYARGRHAYQPPTHTDYNVEIRAPKDLSPVQDGGDPSIPTIVVTEYVDSDASRNRVQELLIEAKRLHRRQRTSRTMSGHRHSWQEPSADLYTVLEEGRTHEVAVLSESDDDIVDDESDDEELNSEDEALYAEDDEEFDYGWAPTPQQPSFENRARL